MASTSEDAIRVQGQRDSDVPWCYLAPLTNPKSKIQNHVERRYQMTTW
ncbi:MAG: hypothetical protein HY690_20155 [Chloroflexi bacterium]|nr:hypothetical protein [Chloroflexota bacterium]